MSREEAGTGPGKSKRGSGPQAAIKPCFIATGECFRSGSVRKVPGSH